MFWYALELLLVHKVKKHCSMKFLNLAGSLEYLSWQAISTQAEKEASAGDIRRADKETWSYAI